MTPTYWYSSMLEDLRIRNARAHASLLSPAALPLRAWLEQMLGAPPGDPNGLISTPVFEHKFGFQSCEHTMNDLVKQGLISEGLCSRMAKPPKKHKDEAFPRDRRPYTHQLEAWQTLKRKETTSVVVSAGTGAGKTECFLVPILDDLARQAEKKHKPLEGVQALFLYPLNALIKSQRERLSAWTGGFNGNVRFCLYNGETKRTEKAAIQHAAPAEVLSRKLLRNSPPPLLITNATMLEYMLVRPEDNDILEKSKGKLKYIVIDEAHTYVGSMAAELALLLRRVMNAFEVDPANVRFIATSATLSSGEGTDAVEEIRKFLADIAGQPASRVEVVTDQRAIPSLPERKLAGNIPDTDTLAALLPEERFEQLCAYRAPRMLRETLVEQGAHTVRDLESSLTDHGMPMSTNDIVRLLDICKSAVPKPVKGTPPAEAFLPLRGHVFVRGIEGLWACLNPNCSGRRGSTLESEAWPFGDVFSSKRERCPHEGCGSPVLDLILCQQCGTESLLASLGEDEDQFEVINPLPYATFSDPAEDQAEVDTGDDDVDDPDETLEEDVTYERPDARLISRSQPKTKPNAGFEPRVPIDPITGFVDPADNAQHFGLVRTDADGKMHCPQCGHGDRKDRLFFRPCRTGRNFLLGVSVPVLLEYMREEKSKYALPFDGRRTISFTDSRQGTARFAARSQGESERNFVRSFIYHQVMSEQSADPAKVAELTEELAKLRKDAEELSTIGRAGLLDKYIQDKEQELAAQSSQKAIPVTDIATRLAQTNDFGHLHTYWKNYLPFQETGHNEGTLAKWLVMREFARRPLRRASLETLGLLQVKFPDLDLRRRPPEVWRQWAGEHAESSWHDFLKLLLDFYVRSNSAVQLDNDFFRWVGTTIKAKTVGGPRSKTIRNKKVSWPRFATRTRPRLGWLVVRAFQLDPEKPANLQRVNDVLDAAWEAIKPALQTTLDGYQLVMDKMMLEPVTEAWLCPITRMLLDTTLLGHTPYQPPLERSFDTRSRKVPIPHTTEPFWNSGDPATWLESDPVVVAAREAGALSEFAERVLSGTRYFQVAEHSAQLQTSALKKAEDDFRAGKLNLLSCSTTMEMGVDIGNLSGVAMNNAPPSPANFLQRVGRAGRRGENAAVSLTACRHLPHDQAVFADPDWPFRAPIHITPVKLDSQRIVERHVRSSALTAFLKSVVNDESIRTLSCAWFFQTAEDQDHSVCDRLVEWLQDGATRDANLELKLTRLVSGSALHGVPVKTLLAECMEAFEAAKQRYDAQWSGIDEQIQALREAETTESPAWYALDRQKQRIEQEYLLSILADEQVLPGYGFPSGVVPLVTTTLEEIRALKKSDDKAKAKRKHGTRETDDERSHREDARARLMGFPSRDLPVAIREYAPGGNIVLERRTYAPRGVTLNWHLPPEAGRDNMKDVQALREAWRCVRCGATGTSQLKSPKACPNCNASKLRRSRYLEPAGFAVDLFEDAHMDAAPAAYIPMEEPWISSGSGPFESIGRPALIRFRHAHDGEVVHVNGGLHSHGYAVCLRCGRAEPETEAHGEDGATEVPTKMKRHLRLRGGKGSNWRDKEAGARCEGNESSWAIQRHLNFGGSARTDVLEIRLLDPTTGQLAEDRILLTTIAVALRKESARALGVDERELGYQVVRRTDGDTRGRAILIYDTAAGGAGFSAEIPPMLPMLLQRAVQTCRCPRDCDQACHSCLLSNDTQHDLDHIDRRVLAPADGGAPTLLTDEFLKALALPDAYKVFGPETRTLWGNPRLGLLRHVRRHAGSGVAISVRMFAGGDGHAWDPVAWSGRDLVRALSTLGSVSVELVVPSNELEHLEWQQRRQLAGLVEGEGLQLRKREAAATPDVRTWAEVQVDETITGFGTDGSVDLHEAWATRSEDGLHVYGPLEARPDGGVSMDPASLLSAKEPAVATVNLRGTAKGRARDFGERFWSAMDDGATGLIAEMQRREAADRIVYQDRYLNSPQAVQSLYQILLHLQTLGVVGSTTKLQVYAIEGSNNKHPSELGHDWRTPERQRDVIEGLFGVLGCGFELKLVPYYKKKETQHHRSLEIGWGAKELEIRLDWGFGFVQPVGRVKHPFDRDVSEQVSKLMQGNWDTQGPYGRGEVPGYVIR